MTTPTMNLNAGPITAGGHVGNVNCNNIIYNWKPEEQRVELANWVSDLDFSPYQLQAYERYTEGTLLWVLDKPEFVAWLRDGGMLWCPGKPGVGKTVFASFIIHYLQNLNTNVIVCYIYCRYHTTRSTLQLFEAILRQLILRCPSMNIDHLQAAMKRDERLTLKEILAILQKTFDHTPNIFLVIDAFDECFDESTRHRVLRHLQLFTSVNCLITSRPLPSIKGAMGSAHRLVISAQGVDIRTHFRAEAKTNPRLAKLIPKVSDTDVEGKLVEKADGRFLLAGLHITNLAAQTNVNQLLNALETLPQEVTASYEETLDRIRHQDSNQHRLAFHTLSWILHALRPLTMIELRHALAIGRCIGMATEQDLDDEESIISSCAGLVIVDKESQRVTFLHYTVQEFLWEARTAPDFLSDTEITLRCMRVVSFPGIRSRPSNYPLISYAASTWGPLVRRHEQDEIVFERALTQLRDPLTARNLSHARIETGFRSYCGDYQGGCATTMHLVAIYGLVRTTKALIARKPACINEKDNQGCTALIWAARNGHLETVKELLSHPNVDVDSEDQEGRSPLSWAAENGHLEVLKELSRYHNVDVNLIFSAALHGRLAVLKELLTHNVDINSSGDKYGQSLLCWAAERGLLEVVKELLSHPDVDVNTRDDQFGQTPLSGAAGTGRLEVVKELLNHPNVDVDSKSNSGRTPLSWAARQGHLEVVKELLIHPKVDINAKDKYGLTPLSWAAENGHLAVVKEFLAQPNVDVVSKSKSGYTLLSLAAGNGHLDVVKELLRRSKVDIDSKDGFGETPLSLATKNGHSKVVTELLMHRGTGIKSRDLPPRNSPALPSW